MHHVSCPCTDKLEGVPTWHSCWGMVWTIDSLWYNNYLCLINQMRLLASKSVEGGQLWSKWIQYPGVVELVAKCERGDTIIDLSSSIGSWWPMRGSSHAPQWAVDHGHHWSHQCQPSLPPVILPLQKQRERERGSGNTSWFLFLGPSLPAACAR